MRVLMLLMCAALAVGCGEDPEPTEFDVRDDYLVQLTCDKDTPDYLMQPVSFGNTSLFIGHPLRDGEPVPDAELRQKYFGDFHYKADGTWARCNSYDPGKALTFGSNGYNQMSCGHPDTAPVELIVWVPASMDGPESIDPALGCTPTVEAPK